MRTAIIGAALLLLGALAVVFGLIPSDALLDLVERTLPILAFVTAITVVAELASAAGVFTALAEVAARWGRGRTALLWALVVLLAVCCTVFLSLDTTAVLLTPVVVLLARHIGVAPLPFALATVWLANTASLLLPVSNLTNLLAEHRMGVDSPAEFASLTALPALVAVLIPVLILAIVFRRALRGRYEVGERTPIEDRALFVIAVVVLVLLLPALVSGLEVWIPATVAAIVLAIAFAVRRRSALSFSLLPWQLLLFAGGLFLVMEAAHGLGLGAVLAAVAGEGDGPLALLRVAASGMVSANLVDNLPAYLALEPSAGSPERFVALLIGVNAGPLITPWASLATLLWHQRLRALDVEISWRRYALLGLVAAPVTVLAATLALSLV
ncbi:arsenic transporter [Microbacteriaceae bacterium VKM Ac-2855]|nr:arsenic transporter [Microbacteriaceae bacterium VKM Ac-2855]